ncbi:sugar-binding domain-containing protein [Seonamhaeicola maritimus]|uniref:sugar-binding domain-containing protein n=1 Tax=Seonamhaeicola maritimus TaxID=2591822 RepID=UPI0024958BF3|nr:sugar-binding domain-containing protein [Seonamhaeicola maritimus]
MRFTIYSLLLAAFVLLSCENKQTQVRVVEDFNFNWKFVKGEQINAEQVTFDDASWEGVRLPHDWSIIAGYKRENTAASTGFTEGGIGWYRKTFHVPESDKGKIIWLEFDGVYNNSTVWINGKKLGFRPNGYASFCYDLTNHLNYGGENVVTVKVDHTAYVDSRWYTGSGIYRDVRLVKTSKTHIPHWGVRITTPKVDDSEATIHIETKVKNISENTTLDIAVLDENQNIIADSKGNLIKDGVVVQDIVSNAPKLWSIESPNLYTARFTVLENGNVVDKIRTRFGVRSIRFDANKGFFLNGESVKIKGVNLHHDVGAVGAAATKASWEYRVKQLKSIGVNAIRMAHNPHAPILMDVCDEMGMLVMNEFFDEWHKAKDKSVNYLGDNAAGEDISKGYSNIFFDWAEKDLKDLIRRDFNHPSTIMWSIGNEIEWTFPYYSEAYSELNPDAIAYVSIPEFDAEKIKPVFERLSGGVDSLAIVAKQLSKWVKEVDTTRPVICGSVRPSIAFVSGYADAVDVIGFNYRQHNYDIAHETYPNKPILGSENWVAYSEWKAVKDREFVAGIFVWTGFAYLGEAGPWPRKGLNISLFDFAGFKNPRGHFFECLWKPEPKVYMVTTPESLSEYSYSDKDGWKFDMQYTPPPVWDKLRLWEWYKVNEHWNYASEENIVVQTYTNCEEAELFLNGKSLGKQALADFSEVDNIIKWLVPYTEGELKVVGYNKGKIVDEYVMTSTGKPAKIELNSDKEELQANSYDVAHISVKLLDEAGNEIKNLDTEITFNVTGNAELLAVDNGWEMNVAPHNSNKIHTHNGKALAIIRSTKASGFSTITAKIGTIESQPLKINID